MYQAEHSLHEVVAKTRTWKDIFKSSQNSQDVTDTFLVFV